MQSLSLSSFSRIRWLKFSSYCKPCGGSNNICAHEGWCANRKSSGGIARPDPSSVLQIVDKKLPARLRLRPPFVRSFPRLVAVRDLRTDSSYGNAVSPFGKPNGVRKCDQRQSASRSRNIRRSLQPDERRYFQIRCMWPEINQSLPRSSELDPHPIAEATPLLTVSAWAAE